MRGAEHGERRQPTDDVGGLPVAFGPGTANYIPPLLATLGPLARRALLAAVRGNGAGTMELAHDGSARGASSPEAGTEGIAPHRGAVRAPSGWELLAFGPPRGPITLGKGEPLARVTVHDQRAYAALLGFGSVGLGGSYVAGWWDADDLVAVVRVLARWSESTRARLDHMARRWAPVLDVLARRRAPGPGKDRQDVQAHYDLSNEFFELMLDETMTYSCALFDGPGTTLADAQRAKMAHICAKAELRPGDHVLEIGSGWGGLAVFAASTYGCRVTTTTISVRQREYIEKRVAERGLSHLVRVVDEHWRDLQGCFDKLVSVEMVEAVDWRLHDEFFGTCSRLLKNDGLAVVQAIVISDGSFQRAKYREDFVRGTVFPGSCLPSVSSIFSSVSRATDLRAIDLEDIGRHYAQTLRLWSTKWHANSARVQALGLGPSLTRLWSFYLAYCEASFLEGHISDVQVTLAKPHWRGHLKRREA